MGSMITFSVASGQVFLLVSLLFCSNSSFSISLISVSDTTKLLASFTPKFSVSSLLSILSSVTFRKVSELLLESAVFPGTCCRFLSDLLKIFDLVLTDPLGSLKNVESSEEREVSDPAMDSDSEA